MAKLTKAQYVFLNRIQNEDDFGVVRYLSPGQLRTGYILKDKGLVILDGKISSAVIAGNDTDSGMTFVFTDAGRAELAEGGNDASK